MSGRALWIGIGLAFIAAGSPPAVAATTVEERARIAALAKLGLQPGSEEGMGLIRAALADGNPSLRRSAAVVAHTTGASAVVADLRKALVTETDPETVRDMVWALSDLDRTSGSDDVLMAAITGPDTQARVHTLASGRGARLTPLLKPLKSILEEHAWSVTGGLQHGLHGGSANLIASYALRDSMENLYDALLFTSGLVVERGAVIAGLGSSSAAIRSSAYVAVANRNLALDEPPVAPEEGSLCARVARHLFEAARGFARSQTLEALVRALADDPMAKSCVVARFKDAADSVRGLTPVERRSLLRAAGAGEGAIEGAVKKTYDTLPAAASGLAMSKGNPPVRTLSSLFPDFVHSVLEATRCKGKERSFDGVEMQFLPGGRPSAVLPLLSLASAEGCADAAKILGVNQRASYGQDRAILILPQRPEFLACLTEPDPSATSALKEADDSWTPKKTRHVDPRFPVNARKEYAEGKVLLQATVRPSGCVGEVRVLQGILPIVDLEAINAVSGWRYEPRIKNGVAKPFLITASVDFRLIP